MVDAFPYLTVVDAAAASRDLTVKATVFAQLRKVPTPTDEALMDDMIHQASGLIVTYCGREFAREKLTDKYRRDRDRRCTEALWLSRNPVGEVHAIAVDGAALAPSDYELDPKAGKLWRLDSSGNHTAWVWSTLITVQHTSGYELLPGLPHDLESACIEQVKAMFLTTKRDPTLRSETVPDVYQASYAVAGGDSFGKSGLLKSVEGRLDPYCWIHV